MGFWIMRIIYKIDIAKELAKEYEMVQRMRDHPVECIELDIQETRAFLEEFSGLMEDGLANVYHSFSKSYYSYKGIPLKLSKLET
jgi:hypothetical protein